MLHYSTSYNHNTKKLAVRPGRADVESMSSTFNDIGRAQSSEKMEKKIRIFREKMEKKIGIFREKLKKSWKSRAF